MHELAKELGLTNKEALDLCVSLGIGVKSHSSSIEEAQADRARRKAEREGLRRDVQPEEPKVAKKAAKRAAGVEAEPEPVREPTPVAEEVAPVAEPEPAPAIAAAAETVVATPSVVIEPPAVVEPPAAPRSGCRGGARRHCAGRAGTAPVVAPAPAPAPPGTEPLVPAAAAPQCTPTSLSTV